jgi:zinc finger protein
MGNKAEPLFLNLSADDPDLGTTEIESMCMNCHKNVSKFLIILEYSIDTCGTCFQGIPKLLLTKIPFYKEVVLMSFHCDHCDFENNEIQSGAEIKPNGIKIEILIDDVKELNRRVVKTDYSSVRIEELDFEIPAKSQKGEVTTIEGIIDRVVNGLTQDQEKRRLEHPDVAAQIDAFVGKLEDLKKVEKPFTIKIDDISGDAHIENPHAPQTDPKVTVTYYTRNNEQNHALGMYTQEELKEENEEKKNQEEANEHLKPITSDTWNLEELHGEVLQFGTNCPECQAPCETNMKVTTIPHFKDVVLMATNCEACGLKTNEVKSGGGIEEKGVRIEVSVNSRDDFSRDVLKSEFCSLKLRELDVEVGSNALGGRFTTVEGILTAMRDQLAESSAMFGDSADRECQNRLDE